MADVPSALRKVQTEEVSYRSALSEGLFFKIGGVINWLIENAGFKLGDVQSSMVDETTFQAARTTDWVLMDGRSVIGSDYELEGHGTNVPDARARFLRMKDHGAALNPSGDYALGTNQGSANIAHQHSGIPEHFGNVAAFNSGQGGGDNNIAAGATVNNTYTGGTGGSLPTGFGASVLNPVSTGFGYEFSGRICSTNTAKAWCTPCVSVEAVALTGGTFQNENYNNYHFGSDQATLGDSLATNNAPLGHYRGNTVPSGTVVGFNMRLPSDGGLESRPINTLVNFFIKINN